MYCIIHDPEEDGSDMHKDTSARLEKKITKKTLQ